MSQTQQRPSLPIKLADLAPMLPEATLVGDGQTAVSALVHPRFFKSPTDIILITDPAALEVLKSGQVKAAIIAKEIADATPGLEGLLAGYISVSRPRHALAYLLNIFNKPVHTPGVGIHPTAIIGKDTQIGANVEIGPYCVIGDRVKIGANTVLLSQITISADAQVGENGLLYPGVRIGERVMIGNQAIIHNNASIGADGFSFVTPQKGSVESAKEGRGRQEDQDTAKNRDIIRIHSIGTVVVEDNVEIGACACIDRSTLGATLIKRGTKIDNLVQIGHNNTIGENCLIVALVGIGGSSNIGDRTVLGGQAGIADHITVGHDVIVSAQAGVIRDVAPGEVVMGFPAIPARKALKNYMMVGRLSVMHQELKDMKKRLAVLEDQLTQQVDDNNSPKSIHPEKDPAIV